MNLSAELVNVILFLLAIAKVACVTGLVVIIPLAVFDELFHKATGVRRG
ncbi:MAG TPA: hypothetical protein VKP61_00655 [Candidatus Acidoferrum sp.]|nr:hypothetical protein [Candidatus Acidoferrum sp.]